jgi:hypothetical protein
VVVIKSGFIKLIQSKKDLNEVDKRRVEKLNFTDQDIKNNRDLKINKTVYQLASSLFSNAIQIYTADPHQSGK